MNELIDFDLKTQSHIFLTGSVVILFFKLWCKMSHSYKVNILLILILSVVMAYEQVIFIHLMILPMIKKLLYFHGYHCIFNIYLNYRIHSILTILYGT